MKILEVSSLVTPTPPLHGGYGAIETFVHGLGEHFVLSGNDVTVICKPGSSETTAQYTRVESTSEALASEVQSLIAKDKPDVAHVNQRHEGLIRALLEQNVPVLLTIHNNVRAGSGYIDLLGKVGQSEGLYTSTVSANLRDRLLQALANGQIAEPRNGVEALGIGVDLTPFKQLRENVTRDAFLYLGVMAAYKGVLTIARSFQNNGFPLRIVGPCNNPAEQEYFEEVKSVIAQSPNIEYVGPTRSLQHKADLLNRSLGLVIATGIEPPEIDCHEAFGVVLVESGIMGGAIVGYNQGNVGYYVQPGINGELYNNAEGMDAAAKLVQATNYGDGPVQIASQFDLPVIADNYVQFLHNISSLRR